MMYRACRQLLVVHQCHELTALSTPRREYGQPISTSHARRNTLLAAQPAIRESI